MYRVQRAEADRLHALRRSVQAAAERADRKGQAHKALDMWQRAEHLKVCVCVCVCVCLAHKAHDMWQRAEHLKVVVYVQICAGGEDSRGGHIIEATRMLGLW